MRTTFFLLLALFGALSSNAQNQISNKMTVSIEGSSSLDLESLYGGGLKIDRKINNNFSVGVFSSVYVQFLEGFYSNGGTVSAASDDGNRVVYEFKADERDSLDYNNGYLYVGDPEDEVINLQIGVQLKYRLFSHKATKPYVGFNLSYNKQFPIGKSESVTVNRLPDNNGILTSLELGFDHDISNRFAFFMNVRASLLTNLVLHHTDLNTLSVVETPDRVIDEGNGFSYVIEGYGIDSATFEEIDNQKKYPSFFGNVGISYKIY